MKAALRLRWISVSTLAIGMSASLLYAGTITGVLETPGGLPVSNGTLAFTLRQAGLQIGSGEIVPITTDCYTSADGTVVGLPNPSDITVTSANGGSGALPAGVYYVQITFYTNDPTAQETLPSLEQRVRLSSAGRLIVSPPESLPANVTGLRVYIGTAPGTEQLQGQTTGRDEQFIQTTPLGSGAAPPPINTSVCSVAFNDTIIPYTGYEVSLISSKGDAYPGWPQLWQLNGGLHGTVNVSQGAPLWNGMTIYPQPIMAQPLNHGPQSISGPLNFSDYNIVNISRIGVGTSTPSWPIDVENGAINSRDGYLVDGSAGISGQCLVSNGDAFVPDTCFTGPMYYQSVESDGSGIPQEPSMNFSNAFSVSDSPGLTTTIGLAPSGVIPGSYINANITVNDKGQVTAATNGPSIPTTQAVKLVAGICTTASNSYSTCDNAVIWPAPFSDANYMVACSANNPSDARAAVNGIINKTASGVTVRIVTEGSVAITYSEIDCLGVHP